VSSRGAHGTTGDYWASFPLFCFYGGTFHESEDWTAIGVHPDRATRGDCDHRDLDWPVSACGAEGPRGGRTRPMPKQHEAERDGPAQLADGLRIFPPRFRGGEQPKVRSPPPIQRLWQDFVDGVDPAVY